MLNIEERIKNWWKKSSWFRRFSDIFFYLFILIPATRTPIMTTVQKIKMFSPKVSETAGAPLLQEEDYSMSFISLDGDQVKLEDFKNEVVLLNFWATWCPPCRAEMPSLQKLYDSYGDKIKMVLVSSEDRGTIMEFLEKYNYKMPVYLQASQNSSSFPVSSIPKTYLISREGRIMLSKTGVANWNSDKFKAELNELIN